MKIKTHIAYEETYIPPRCRKVRIREIEKDVYITLREAKASDLKLAFEYAAYDGFYGDGMHKIFAYGGKLWRKAVLRTVCAGEPEPGRYETPLEALVWWNQHGSKYLNPSYIRSHTQQGVIGKAVSDMSQYLLVDGELFVRTGEPRYCVYTFGLGHNHGGTSLSIDDYYNPNISKECYFSALDREAAVAYATKVATGRGDTESVPRVQKPNIIVHMPEAVKVCPSKQHSDGNPILKSLNAMTAIADSAAEAGILCMATAMAGLA